MLGKILCFFGIHSYVDCEFRELEHFDVLILRCKHCDHIRSLMMDFK